MTKGFTIDDRGRLVLLWPADDKSQATLEANERTIREHRSEYDEFIERVSRGDGPIELMPTRVRDEVGKMRTGGLAQIEAKRHAQASKDLAENRTRSQKASEALKQETVARQKQAQDEAKDRATFGRSEPGKAAMDAYHSEGAKAKRAEVGRFISKLNKVKPKNPKARRK